MMETEMKILFRPMQRGDLDRIAVLERICFRTHGQRQPLQGN